MAERSEKKRGLGRGLSALMADVDTSGAVNDGTPAAADRLVPIEKIVPNPNQPRRLFTQDQLDDLANSIRTKGVIQPLIVRVAPQDETCFEIVAGERRWRAAQMAQLHELPVIVRALDDTEVLEIAIIENIQRADLTPLEEAAGYRQLMFKFGHTQEKLAEALGKSRSHIANMMRLLNLPQDVQDLVSTGDLSAGHARALITAPNPSELAQDVVRKALSVRETEKLAKDRTPPEGRRTPPPGGLELEKDPDTRALEGDLSAALGMKVQITHKLNSEKGKLSISYESLDQLDALCQRLGSRG